MTGQPKIAVFDFDGTLTRTDTIKFLLASLLLWRPLKISVLCLFFSRLFWGKIDIQQFKSIAIGLLIQNKTPVQVNAMMGIYRNLAARYFRLPTTQQFSALEGQGYRMVIATASPDFAVKSVYAGRSVEVIGTQYAVQAGKYTGKLWGKVCLGQEKARRLVEHLGTTQRIEIAFSDGGSDTPLLEMAQKAFLVDTRGALLKWEKGAPLRRSESRPRGELGGDCR